MPATSRRAPGRLAAALLLVSGALLLLAACGRAAATPPAASGPAPAAPPAPQSAAPAPPIPVIFNWTQPSGSMSPIWVTYEAGYFREEGLDVDLLNIPNTSRVLQTMAAGEVHLSPLDPLSVVRASFGGLDVVLLFAQTNRLMFGLYAQPGITDAQQLRGKVVATTRVGASNHTATVVALERFGLVPDRDVALRQLGEVPAIYAAMQTGQVDAATLGLPPNRGALPNIVELLNLGRDGPAYPSIAIGGPRAWVSTNEEALRRFARAYVRGIHRFKHDRAFTMEVYRKYFQADDTPFFEESWELFRQAIPDAPYVSEEGFARILQDLAGEEPRAAGRQPAEWLDARFVRELDQSGFIRALSSASAP